MKTKILTAALILTGAAALRAAFINDSAPAFTLPTMNGKPVSLADYRGKVVFINFWASWCPPCKEEFPELNELANEYRDQGVAVLGINLDKSQNRIQKYLAKIKVHPTAMTILLDPKAEVVSKYVARSMPSSFIIDGRGVIRIVHFGYGEKDPGKWREEINRLLAEGKK